MGFAGELATIGLPEVFRNISFNRLTGLLTIAGESDGAIVYFEDGAIRAFSGGADKEFDYEALAIQAAAAPADVVERARMRPRRLTLKQALRETDSFLEDRFDAAVRAAVSEEIVLLFQRSKDSFVFDEELPQPGVFDMEQLGCDIAIDPEALVVEAARREEEWHTISTHIGSESEIFVADTDKDADTKVLMEGLDGDAETLIGLLDGTRNLQTALEQLPGARFEKLRLVAQLMERGLVMRAGPADLRALAKRAQSEGKINRAAALLTSAIERSPDALDVRRELIALYAEAGRKSDAALAHKEVAAVQEKLGDIKGAIQSYEEAAELAPYDTDTLERLASIHHARGDARAHQKSGRRLADTLAAQGRYDKALAVLQDLLTRDPQNIPLREAIAATYIKMHEPQNAAQELLSLAESSSAVNGYHRALHYYRSVLAVDRSCSVAARRIEEIEAVRERARRRDRRRQLVTMLIALVIGGVLWQGAREYFAQEALNAAADATAGASATQTVRHYVSICRDFPWTLGAARADEVVRARLLAELHRIRTELMKADPDAAQRAVRTLGRVQFPDELRSFWHKVRDNTLRRIAEHRRAIAGAKRR